MTGLGIYKLDNGQSYPSNCFPVRSFFHPRNEGAGHWLVANRNTLEERTSKRKNISGSRFEVHSGKHEQRRPESASNTLDAQLFLTLHCVDKPSDLCSVNISGQHLQTVKLEGLEQFDNTAYINASDNHLTLEPFARFPALRELELSLNSLHDLEIHAEEFQKLEVLDLSFNNLTGESILNVGLLPHLKVLHLTGNQLQMLPLNMAGPCTCPGENTEQGVSLFQTLEVLMLDDNKLSSPGVFMSLANLKRLRHLNLQGNYISGVPFLEQMATLQDAQKGIMPQSIGQNVNTVNDERTKYSDITMSQQKTEKILKEDKACLEMHSGPLQYYHQRKEVGCAQGLRLPFPELCNLNLANNEIAEEEALLPVALFPKLSELVIHSNPLTTQRSGDPPMLTCFLQDKLGIKITRKKTTNLIKRHILPRRKVKPTLPKFPSITANQHATETLFSKKCTGQDNPLPLEYGLTHVFGFSSQTSIDDEEDIDIGQEHFDLTSADIFFETNQNAEPFFVTEINGLNESEYQEDPDDSKETELEKGSKACPEKLIGYEILLDDTPELEMPEFSGIQQAVSVLEHMLKNLLVYRDSKANLDLPQKPYTEREKKIKNLPPLGPKKSKEEKVEELLAQIKEVKTISKVPLDNVLEGGNGICKREYEEALTLLKDMKRKYRTAYLKRVEQAAQIETKIMYNLN
ncbi:X-ray radiation resistance-associated protein 1-like [Sinocyclocheilus rhinocerous]|uniref:X-ray radiation resistance-associated protein 1-like n=1 Tax=Sinocyclocheilus rhinocerous TaxID=307959 RepID=UPI0007B9F4B3|nr:PREDICTED: X-ray radiation resistance-associated protein 1-like [Sinocyclocheilus rhinocerous]